MRPVSREEPVCPHTRSRDGPPTVSDPSPPPFFLYGPTLRLLSSQSRGEGGRAPLSVSPAFVAHVKCMVQGWLDTARARKKEKDATTPKSRAAGKGGRRAAAVGGTWNPHVGGVGMIRQVRL